MCQSGWLLLKEFFVLKQVLFCHMHTKYDSPEVQNGDWFCFISKSRIFSSPNHRLDFFSKVSNRNNFFVQASYKKLLVWSFHQKSDGSENWFKKCFWFCFSSIFKLLFSRKNRPTYVPQISLKNFTPAKVHSGEKKTLIFILCSGL